MNENDNTRGKRRRIRAKPLAELPHARKPSRAREAAPAVPPESGVEKVTKICGLAAVTALFRCDPERAVRLYFSEAMKTAAGSFCARMAGARRIYRLVGEDELERIAGTVHHGGIVVATQARVLTEFDSDAAERWADAGEPLVVLDGVGNPHNLGAIARTMAFFGIRRLLISGHQAQAGLSDAAYRIAEGGLEFLEIYETRNLALTLKELKESYRVIGTALRGGKPLGALRADPRPVCLVLGNEENGLPPATLHACDALVTIRGCGAVQSLNVSTTAAILISQIFSRAGAARRPVSTTPGPRRQTSSRRR